MSANLSSQELQKAIDLAIDAKTRAYCPYSKFRVGSVVVTKSGLMFYGANVENAAYPNTICAERSAICTAVSAGYAEFKAVVVTTDNPEFKWPCGACRQSICEFACDGCEVISVKPDRCIDVKKFVELHPNGFKRCDLDV